MPTQPSNSQLLQGWPQKPESHHREPVNHQLSLNKPAKYTQPGNLSQSHPAQPGQTQRPPTNNQATSSQRI